jgi:hypothetical protein
VIGFLVELEWSDIEFLLEININLEGCLSEAAIQPGPRTVDTLSFLLGCSTS